MSCLTSPPGSLAPPPMSLAPPSTRLAPPPTRPAPPPTSTAPVSKRPTPPLTRPVSPPLSSCRSQLGEWVLVPGHIKSINVVDQNVHMIFDYEYQDTKLSWSNVIIM